MTGSESNTQDRKGKAPIRSIPSTQVEDASGKPCQKENIQNIRVGYIDENSTIEVAGITCYEIVKGNMKSML